jgi:Tol biopolymer transport system component
MAPEHSAWSAGSSVGRYRIAEKIGEGGMGVVYKAHDERLDRFVAIKVLPPSKSGDSERCQRFIQEARTASALEHPNIIHIYDIDEWGGRLFIAMEYVAGRALDRVIPKRGLPLADVLKYAIQIADGLAKAHAAGIVHRDLKPGNLMVSEEGRIKILDFGLAKLVETGGSSEDESTRGLTEEGVVVGTTAYMSPEQAEGRPLDARSDIFSFGAVLFEMITGSRAFGGGSRASVMASILREEPKFPAESTQAVPRELEKVVARCLRKDPERRFQHMSDLKVALQELKEESDSGAIAASSSAAPRRWKPVVWVAVLALVLAAAAVWWLRPPAQAPVISPVPLTGYPGVERDPSFSPDGKQVAYAWDGLKEDNFDIYIKLVGSGPPLRLTTNPDVDYSPAWSPDGSSIAFLRSAEAPGFGANEVMLISALGGPERKLGQVDLRGMYQSLAWSPDGKWLAVADGPDNKAATMCLLSPDTGEKRRLTSPPVSSQGDRMPVFSPDGEALAFSRCVLDTVCDVWLLRLSRDYQAVGEPRRLTSENGWLSSPAWTSDGREIIYSTGAWGSSLLHAVTLSGKVRGLPFIPSGANEPAIAARGGQMAYVALSDNINIWKVAIGDDGRSTVPASKLIASARIEQTPAFSADGKRIAFASCRSGNWEIWASDANGENAVQLTHLGSVLARSPAWSPDGNRIAFDMRTGGRADIYVMSAAGGRPQRVTTDPANATRPTWSRDGRFLYFAAGRGGRNEIWKIPAEGGEAVQITHRGGLVAEEGPDGILYFLSDMHSSVWMIPAGGGVETKLTDRQFYNLAVAPSGVFAIDGRDLLFYRFSNGETHVVGQLPGWPHMGLAASPDGRSVLYAQIDTESSSLMLVEGFR